MQLRGIHIAINEISTEMHDERELNPNQTMHHLPPSLNYREAEAEHLRFKSHRFHKASLHIHWLQPWLFKSLSNQD